MPHSFCSQILTLSLEVARMLRFGLQGQQVSRGKSGWKVFCDFTAVQSDLHSFVSIVVKSGDNGHSISLGLCCGSHRLT